MSSRTREDVISAGFPGGEGVLFDLKSKQYFRLNETAMLVWRGLERAKSVDEILAQMTQEYDVAPEHARRSVEQVIASFTASRLLRTERDE